MTKARRKHRRHSRHYLDLGSRYRVGSPPGALEPHPEAAPTVLRRTTYDANTVHEERFENTIPKDKLAREPNRVLWLDVVGLGSEEALKHLVESFSLHALAVEDVLHQRQRPKAEVYGDTLFIVVRIPHVREGGMAFEQVSMFLGRDFVLTFQEEEGDCFDSVRERLRRKQGRVRQNGPDYLVYTLLDSAIDQYLPLADSMGDRLDEMEREVLSSSDSAVVQRLLDLRSDLNQLRRNVAPARDAVAAMASLAGTLVSDETKIYLRDCQDHIVQLNEVTESYGDTVSALVSIHLSLASHRLNEVMKVLTVFASLFMPLSFIASLYGMNFDPAVSPYNMPELKWGYGYPAVLLAMLLLAGGLVFFFRRRGWLGGSE
ncbi:MAG: magnesium/cobalt transporter CorA [Polyangiales bacterium]